MRFRPLFFRTLSAYAVLGPWPVLRAAVRFFTAPLARVADSLPEKGLILDVGCGQGHFLRYCSFIGHKNLIGVEPSLRGLRRGRLILPEEVALIQAKAEEIPVSICTAIVALDVLYLLSPVKQEAFLDQAASILPPGGILLIKTMDPKRKVRQFFNRFQETLAVRIFRLTLGKDFFFRQTSQWVDLCEKRGFKAEVIPLWNGYLHPHVLIKATRPFSSPIQNT